MIYRGNFKFETNNQSLEVLKNPLPRPCKNTAQIHLLFGLYNLFRVRKKLILNLDKLSNTSTDAKTINKASAEKQKT